MEKSINIIAYQKEALEEYLSLLKDIFKDKLCMRAYCLASNTVYHFEEADLYLVSTSAIDQDPDLLSSIPQDKQIVPISVDIQKSALSKLRAIPEDTDVLLVNTNPLMTVETISQLKWLGINHLKFYPYYPGAVTSATHCKLAIAFGTKQHVPNHIEETLDLGNRILRGEVIAEIALRLGLGEILDSAAFHAHRALLAESIYSVESTYRNSLLMESRFEWLVKNSFNGILGINEKDVVFACNDKCEKILGLAAANIIGKDANLTLSQDTLLTFLHKREKIFEQIIEINGNLIVVSVLPLISNAMYRGIFFILEKFTEQEKNHIKTRLQLLHKGHRAKYTFDDILGGSTKIKEAIHIAKKMASMPASILITGETGTGKELFAHAIHQHSQRAQFPFLAINCAAMPESLMESELFGYEPGAFTGARKGGKLGIFEFAHKGTLFLDEVEEMSYAMQTKLLRVLQEKEVMRIGGMETVDVDVRIIAASNKNILHMVKQGNFRKDLYYRLSPLSLDIPPLCQRKEDIPSIISHIQRKNAYDFIIFEDTVEVLMAYPWDGNVRELENSIHYLACLDQPIIHPSHLPKNILDWYKSMRDLVHMRACTYSENQEQNQVLASTYDDEFRCLTGKREEEYLFLLQSIYTSTTKKQTVGRKTLSLLAEQNSFYLSEQEVRTILMKLELWGYVIILQGRRGTKITPKGKSLLENYARIDIQVDQ